MRLKEYFYNEDSVNKDNDFKQNQPFFNKKHSTFIPPNGRDIYLDFYIEAITHEITKDSIHRKLYSNISKTELDALRKLASDTSIII